MEPHLYLQPLLATLEPRGSFTWNPYLEPRSLGEPCGSASGNSLAEIPKLSAVREKCLSGQRQTLKSQSEAFLTSFGDPEAFLDAVCPPCHCSLPRRTMALVLGRHPEQRPCCKPAGKLPQQTSRLKLAMQVQNHPRPYLPGTTKWTAYQTSTVQHYLPRSDDQSPN